MRGNVVVNPIDDGLEIVNILSSVDFQETFITVDDKMWHRLVSSSDLRHSWESLILMNGGYVATSWELMDDEQGNGYLLLKSVFG